MNDVSRVLPDLPDDASSVLLLAPSSDPLDDHACIDLLTLSDPRTENVLSVTVSETPEDRFAIWHQHVGEPLPERVAILATDESVRRSESATAAGALPITVDVLPEGVDPITFATRIAQYLGRWEGTPESTVVCIHSVTALLETLSLPDVCMLLRALNDSFDAMGVTGHCHLDPTAHDAQTLAALRPLFDAVLEYTEDDGWSVTRPDPESDPDTPSVITVATEAGSRLESPSTVDRSPLARSFDAVLDLLSAPERRAVLYAFAARDADTVELETLVDWVCDLGPTVGKPSWASARRELLLSLVHAHLPKLEDSDIIAFDRDERTVRYDATAAPRAYVEHVHALETGEAV